MINFNRLLCSCDASISMQDDIPSSTSRLRTKRNASVTSVPDGKMIVDTEPIFTHLISILDNKTRYNRFVLPKNNLQKKIVIRVGVNIQTINSVDEKQRVRFEV